MQAKRETPIILFIGLGILLASLFADQIGVGDDPGFGRQQTLGTVVGIFITAVGIFYGLLKKS